MLDGVKLTCILEDFHWWRNEANIDLSAMTDTHSGEIKTRRKNIKGGFLLTVYHKGKFQTYNIEVKESNKITLEGKGSTSFFLTITGSFHKNYFGGENYQSFSWNDLQHEINNLEYGLRLPAGLLKLENLEIGLNITLRDSPYSYLEKNLIAYKGKSFNQYDPDRNGVCLGYVCNLRQYSVKVYDKGKQYNLPDNLLRFELRYKKMQTLNRCSIKTLQDLRKHELIFPLFRLLVVAWSNVLLYDSGINLKDQSIKSSERILLDKGTNPRYWVKLKRENDRRFRYQRTEFKELVKKYGNGEQKRISELFESVWRNLFNDCRNLPGVQISGLSDFTVKINSNNCQFSYTIKRECQSCGKDISNQNPRSKFCSSKYVGEAAAHKCRNDNSNPRNNFKHKLRRIENRGVLFDIKPFIVSFSTKIKNK